MGLQFDKALGLHADALRLRADRTKVLASNLANASTPGYQARDVDFGAALARARGDDPMLALDTLLGSASPDLLYRLPQHPAQDGNTVELGVEQAAFAQNVSDFQISLRFVDMKLKGLAKAIAGQ